MLHRAEGAGSLLTGDIIQVIPNRHLVGFMWSYRMSAAGGQVRPIGAAGSRSARRSPAHGGFACPFRAARTSVRRSVDRYGASLGAR